LAGLLVLVALTMLLWRSLSGGIRDPYWMPPGLLWDDQIWRGGWCSICVCRASSSAFLVRRLSGRQPASVLQMVFRNPLVSPGFLGVSQGAGFGAAVAIVFL
jgi:iron complex transport system permease protein